MSDSPASDQDSSAGTRPPIALPEGTQLRDEYRLGAVLGAGSFGITYRAVDEHLDTEVAIKEYYPRHLAGRTNGVGKVRPHTQEDAEAFAFGREQFMQEGRTVARFDHPNIVDVRSYFEEHGTGYLVMDYYDGRTLSEYLEDNGGWLPEEEALDLIEDITDGLKPVHSEGVLHRDIDPQNVYRTAEGKAVLIDFGAAREAMAAQSRDLSVILKPGYAPFEQYSPDGEQGPHTDVYACSATLYKCLTGLTPPDATERIGSDELVPPRDVRPEISLETSVAVMKGLAVHPDQRPESVDAFASLLGGTKTAVGPDEAPTQTATPETPTVDEAAAEELSEKSADVAAGGEPEAEAEDRSSGGSILSVVFLALGIAGIVAGTLAISETRAVEILAFFGTWVAVCFGLIGLFREGERVMSSEGRAAVSDWLLREDFVQRQSNWPETFTNLFDAVFTERHLSWTCFWRSGLTSIVVMILLLGGFMGFGLLGDFTPDSAADVSALAFLGIPIALNVGIDYLSLFETRWILGKMSGTRGSVTHVAFMALDLVLTVLCILFPVALVQIITAAPFGEFAIWSTDFWEDVLSLLIVLGEWILRFNQDDARLLSVMFFSTLFTSVWVWLYVGAGLLLRALRPILESLDWIKAHLDVETRPLHSMGLLLAVLTSLGFAVGAPIVL